MKVIDTSAFLAYIFKEPEWRTIQKHLEKGVISIDLIKKEALNVITMRLKRREITEEEYSVMIKATEILTKVNIEIEDQNEILEEATKIAKKKDTTIYDALYIALAKKHGCKLLTLDKQQEKIASQIGVEVEPLRT